MSNIDRYADRTVYIYTKTRDVNKTSTFKTKTKTKVWCLGFVLKVDVLGLVLVLRLSLIHI